jgi:hypothetical protein
MANTLSERSDEENQRNLERFSPLMYQLKQGGTSNSNNHPRMNELIGQEPGAYPYPSGDQRVFPNATLSENEEIIMKLRNGKLFKNQKFL